METLNPPFCEYSELACTYALRALPASEEPLIEAHIASCLNCQHELEKLRPVVDRIISSPADVLRPTASLQERLALRIAEETGKPSVTASAPQWSEPDWEQFAPGIKCKPLAIDTEKHQVSMLVRFAPGARYPAHIHAGQEELHLLDGELWIDERRLVAGDHHYGEPGDRDDHVWSKTGCTCVLITSTRDVLL